MISDLWESSLGENTVDRKRVSILHFGQGATSFQAQSEDLHQQTCLTTSTVTNNDKLATNLGHFSKDSRENINQYSLSKDAVCVEREEKSTLGEANVGNLLGLGC